MTLGRFLYDILDIDFYGSVCGSDSSSGEITISRCYFSSLYSPEACQVMSAMDSGLLAGLAGGGGAQLQPAHHGRVPLLSSPLYARRQSLVTPTVAGANKMKRALVIGSGAGGATAGQRTAGSLRRHRAGGR